ESPRRREVALAAPRLGEDSVADEKAELDADAGEADAFAARLRRRGDIVEASQIRAAHSLSVVDGGEGRRTRIDGESDARRTRVEAVRHDLGEYCLIEVAGVCVGKVLEEMQ